MEEIITSRVDLLQRAHNNPDLQSVEIALCKRDIRYYFNNYTYTDKNTNLYA